MNRFLLIFGLTLSVYSTSAQVSDTLGYANFQLGTEVLYVSPNGGYAFGNNGYGDKVKAQSYAIDSSFVLQSVLLQFGDVVFNSGDSTSSIRVTVYDNFGTGVTSFGVSDSIAPDSALAYVDVPVYMLEDDGGNTLVDFSATTLAIFSRFSIGVDVTMVASADTVGLLSTTDGDAGGALNAWEQTVAGDWFTVEESSYSWGLDVDLAIFPLIDVNHPAGIAHPQNLNWSIFPNPSTGESNIRVPTGQWTVSIYDATGRKVLVESFSGNSKLLDLKGLNQGMFIVKIESGERVGIKRISIL